MRIRQGSGLIWRSGEGLLAYGNVLAYLDEQICKLRHSLTDLWRRELAQDSVETRDNAGIFFFDKPPSAEAVAAIAKKEGANVFINSSSGLIQINAAWPRVTLVISINPNWERNIQLPGLYRWLDGFSHHYYTPRVKEFVSSLDRTVVAYGSVIRPGFDRDGKVVRTLLQLIEKTDGYFLSHQSVYDSKGELLIGLPGDPPQLGPRK